MSLFIKKHLAWLSLPLFLSLFLLAVAAASSASLPLMDSGTVITKGAVRTDTRSAPRCEQVPGLCDKERRLLMPSVDALTLKRLRQQGCKVRHELRGLTSLSCPDSVNLQSARSERVFRLTDLVSAKRLHADVVWSQGARGEGIRVAVLDTGVEADHPELQGRVSMQADFTGTGSQDTLGHGTHVSAIVSGLGLKDLDANRVTGVSTDVSLLVGKVCRDDGWCLEGDILAGIEWAVQQKARVVNLSLGGGSFEAHCDGDALANQANWAVEQGVVVVAAAGNSGTGVASPACASRVIAVGALDGDNAVPVWSSRGEALDVTAPGVDILSAYSCEAAGVCPGAWYAKLSGTSMAAPHVAGVVALILQNHPALRPDQVFDIFTKTSVDLGAAGRDPLYGYGRVDAAAAYAQADIVDPIREDDVGACVDMDGDGISSCNECNDLDASVYPGAIELCNGKDDSCDGRIDEFCRKDTGEDRMTACGNGICEAPETKGSCAIDCSSIVPPRATEASTGRAGGAAASGGAQGGTQSSQTPSGGESAGSRASSNGNAGGNSASAKARGR